MDVSGFGSRAGRAPLVFVFERAEDDVMRMVDLLNQVIDLLLPVKQHRYLPFFGITDLFPVVHGAHADPIHFFRLWWCVGLLLYSLFPS